MVSNQLPGGFRFSGVACGIKASGKPDLSLIVADRPLSAAGVYTQNQIVAAPVVWCRSKTPSSNVRAVVTNSGNANACTGSRGEQDAEAMCLQVAGAMGVDAADVLVMSTGVIGKHLPMDRVRSGIENAAAKLDYGLDAFQDAADAILTTDQQRKVVLRSLSVVAANGAPELVQLAAMAKGAGMIAPNMATMLGVMMTDAILAPQQADRILKQVANLSFNQVSVDGHTSTNDTLLLLASGSSGITIDESNESEFVEQLTSAAIELACQLVEDGEGAKHVMKIHVSGASSDKDAEIIARTIGASPLVKTALTGGDPNWGRIVSAAGYAGPTIQPQKTSLEVAGTTLYSCGTPVEFDAVQVSEQMKASPCVPIALCVGEGPGECTHWASDLTVEYVRFNSEYTT